MKDMENVSEFHSDIDDDQELTYIAEKVMELSIAFVTQYFPADNDRLSPVVHFGDVLGINNRYEKFNEPYNYTSNVAGLIWMMRLLMMEYALPSREYTSLGWPSHEAYERSVERLKSFCRKHLVQGSFSPMSHLISVLMYGRQIIKRVGRLSLMFWDTDYRGIRVKDIYLRLDAFKQFVRDGIKSAEGILTVFRNGFANTRSEWDSRSFERTQVQLLFPEDFSQQPSRRT